ncbi:MAG: hypothetical protein P4L95_02420 [Rouxiella aceris]|uniref:hypothetical protein n=1 Tax=Rouxiella aceris TaxID=2703884 RepID=UPI00283DBA7F|nr:hypothetical protein [Rouxiella aceris]MDR3430756.1 hypothetical protein [Rouxiella aceris]
MTRQRLKVARLGRVGRIAVISALILFLTGLLFFMAAMLFEHDPDGHLIRGWLNESRYWLFVWRLTLYLFLILLWFSVVRPQVIKVSPGGSLHRLEWMAGIFILVIEVAAWRSVMA